METWPVLYLQAVVFWMSEGLTVICVWRVNESFLSDVCSHLSKCGFKTSLYSKLKVTAGDTGVVVVKEQSNFLEKEPHF